MTNNDLFGHSSSPECNLLPYDGAVYYFGKVISNDVADEYFQKFMLDIAWQHDEVNIYGKKILTKRKVAWYGSRPFTYTYSQSTKLALPWTSSLARLKALIEAVSHESFNSCLLNLYHTGEEGMAWHSDAEKELKKHGAIASVSLGAERKFCFKHKRSGEVITQFLESGSLLIMTKETQDHWLHRLPPTKKITQPRINLTFRTINT